MNSQTRSVSVTVSGWSALRASARMTETSHVSANRFIVTRTAKPRAATAAFPAPGLGFVNSTTPFSTKLVMYCSARFKAQYPAMHSANTVLFSG